MAERVDLVDEPIAFLSQEGLLSPKVLRLLRRVRRFARPLIAAQEYFCVVHLDYHFNHVLLDRKLHPSAVIDWGFANASVPAEDFFKLQRYVYPLGEEVKRSFEEGYASVRPLPPQFLQDFFHALWDLFFVMRLVKGGKQDLAAEHLAVVEGVLESLVKHLS